MDDPPKIPVTVLSGFLGAGKTTLLSHLLNNRAGLRVGLIVNDMSEVNVDAALLTSGAVTLSRVEDEVVELSNGCVCCTLRTELLEEMIRLAKQRRFDYLVVESSGISEPLPVAEVFTFSDEKTGERLDVHAYLDTCVTVVDALAFPELYNSENTLADMKTAAFDGDTRNLVDLLVDQVEFANVIIVNKADLVTEAALRRLIATLSTLNPDAKIIPATRGVVPPSAILNTKLFSLAAAAAAPGWLKELRGTHVPESIEFGISSFVFRARRPFHPQRLHSLVYASDTMSSVLRSKGFFWLGCDGGMDDCAIWAHAGRIYQFTTGRTWWANIPKRSWPSSKSAISLLEKDWDATYGDRKQEVVFIGQNMDRPRIEAALTHALLTDEEFAAGPSAWEDYNDPFDFFPYEDDEEEEEDGGGDDEGAEHSKNGDAPGRHGHVHGPQCSHAY